MTDRFSPLVEYLLKEGVFLEEAVELLERALVEGALQRAEGNQSAASKALGIHRNTMKRKIAEYQVEGRRVRRKPVVSAMRKRKAKTANAPK
jgi:DNA-binding NtrC family response regulator